MLKGTHGLTPHAPEPGGRLCAPPGAFRLLWTRRSGLRDGDRRGGLGRASAPCHTDSGPTLATAAVCAETPREVWEFGGAYVNSDHVEAIFRRTDLCERRWTRMLQWANYVA